MSTRIMWFAKTNNLLSPYQFGFQKGIGVIEPLLYFEHFASTALATGNHVSVLSLDFEKAFDRIGVHLVLRELKRWKIGKKIYNFVKSFLQNRKFIVRVNNHKSSIHNLYNGIPQGSPLSVTLFTIAFNELSSVIASFSNVEHVIYADDVLIFSKIIDLRQIEQTFIEILKSINNWSQISGSNIALNKCSSFHICRKHSCSFPPLSLHNIQIPHSDTLKILGLIFDKRLSFKQHCQYVRNSILSRLNIIKFLSSKHCFVHTNTLISITKSLILSKIDYGLSIYGNCAKLHIRLLHAPYHAAARRSIRAFPTSPVRAVLTEAGLPDISYRAEYNTMMLLPKILHCRNQLLFTQINSVSLHARKTRKKSTLTRCLSLVQEMDIISTPTLVKTVCNPPFMIPQSSFISVVQNHHKNKTSSNEYQQIFREALQPYNEGWEIIYTDGSKSDTSTTFAVTNTLGATITVGALPTYCSAFTAEVAALHEAVLYSSRKDAKHIICTDSKSSIDAILNSSNECHLINKIRQNLLQYSSIKVMWVPGHTGIRGNEIADKRAKEAGTEPLLFFDYLTNADIRKLCKKQQHVRWQTEWSKYKHFYKNCNPDGARSTFPVNLPIKNIKNFVRLRIGHTIATHTHLLNGDSAPPCPSCGDCNLTVSYLLDDCPEKQHIRTALFTKTKPF